MANKRRHTIKAERTGSLPCTPERCRVAEDVNCAFVLFACYKNVAGLANKEVSNPVGWGGWNRIPAPTSPAISYN